MNKFVRWGASMAVLAVLAAPASAQTFRWTSQGDALTMDPHAQNEGPTIALTGQIYESLVSRDPALNLVPELATEWEPVEGGWRFKLREGVKFHDGADFTAEDVVFSFERANAATSDWKEQVASISEVQVVNDHEVILVTDGPNPILPNQLTSVFIMDKGWAEANNVVAPQDFAGKEETFAVRNANGTGPYILDERAPDELTTMHRNAAGGAGTATRATSSASSTGPSATPRPASRRCCRARWTSCSTRRFRTSSASRRRRAEGGDGEPRSARSSSAWIRASTSCATARSRATRSRTCGCARPSTWPSTRTPSSAW
jgi:ABC-type transport system substrate-binding protein